MWKRWQMKGGILDPRDPQYKWVSRALSFAVLAVLYAVFTCVDPQRARLQEAERQLAAAGYPDAEVGRYQDTDEMAKCKVGQVQHRGYAYPWSNETARGVFCYPLDGRPTRVIVEGGAAQRRR